MSSGYQAVYFVQRYQRLGRTAPFLPREKNESLNLSLLMKMEAVGSSESLTPIFKW
jgi:hypothetical protein